MDFKDFATGKYNNRPSDYFFEHFDIPEFGAFNIFNMTDCEWFIANEEKIPSGIKTRKIVMYNENNKNIEKGFDQLIVKDNFTVGIERESYDGHNYCYIFCNKKYVKFSEDIEVNEEDWFDIYEEIEE